MTLGEWAARWNVPGQAVRELQELTTPDHVAEGTTTNRIRLAAAKDGVRLLRNNSGQLFNDEGRPVRYGLGNDSKKVNQHMKSSDWIGMTPVYIQQHHVGRAMAVFTAVEEKPPTWNVNKRLDEHEQAQSNFLLAVTAAGGIATFATCYDHVSHRIREFIA